MLVLSFIALAAADDPMACEVLMSVAPPPPVEDSQWCSDPDDPRCQWEKGDAPASSLPRLEQRVATEAPKVKLVLGAPPRGTFDEARPLDSGVVSSLFRPPR